MKPFKKGSDFKELGLVLIEKGLKNESVRVASPEINRKYCQMHNRIQQVNSRTSWLPSKKESNTWAGNFSQLSEAFKLLRNKR